MRDGPFQSVYDDTMYLSCYLVALAVELCQFPIQSLYTQTCQRFFPLRGSRNP